MRKDKAKLNREIGIRLEKARENSGYSQENMANMLGVSVSQYQRYERGTSSIPADIIVAIHEVLEIDLNYLYTGKTSTEKTESEQLFQTYLELNWHDKVNFFERISRFVLFKMKTFDDNRK